MRGSWRMAMATLVNGADRNKGNIAIRGQIGFNQPFDRIFGLLF